MASLPRRFTLKFSNPEAVPISRTEAIAEALSVQRESAPQFAVLNVTTALIIVLPLMESISSEPPI